MTIINSYNNNRLFSVISFSVQEAYYVILPFHASRVLYSIFLLYSSFFILYVKLVVYISTKFLEWRKQKGINVQLPWLSHS